MVCRGKAPAFLGSSFAFIAPTITCITFASTLQLGFAHATGGFVFAALAFVMVSLIIRSMVFRQLPSGHPCTDRRNRRAPALRSRQPVGIRDHRLLHRDRRALVVISQHIGHLFVTSNIVGRNLLKVPWVHNSLLGDGLSTALSGLTGSCPITNYGENMGVMAITRVYSVWVIGRAAVISLVVAFFGQVSGAIRALPVPVIGGISMMLFGVIAAPSLRVLIEAKATTPAPGTCSSRRWSPSSASPAFPSRSATRSSRGWPSPTWSASS